MKQENRRIEGPQFARDFATTKQQAQQKSATDS